MRKLIYERRRGALKCWLLGVLEELFELIEDEQEVAAESIPPGAVFELFVDRSSGADTGCDILPCYRPKRRLSFLDEVGDRICSPGVRNDGNEPGVAEPFQLGFLSPYKTVSRVARRF